jgi:hypothetical protein
MFSASHFLNFPADIQFDRYRSAIKGVRTTPAASLRGESQKQFVLTLLSYQKMNLSQEHFGL